MAFFISRFRFTTLFLLLAFSAQAQKTIVTGWVKDKATGLPLPYVTVAFEGSSNGMFTLEDGSFHIETQQVGTIRLKVSMMGYENQSLSVQQGKKQSLTIYLKESSSELEEVRVVAQKERYRNKGNPAVELIRRVREHASENLKGGRYVQYERYDRLQLSLCQDMDINPKKRLFKKYPFMTAHADTLTWPNKILYPVYMEEEVSWHDKDNGEGKHDSSVLAREKTSLGQFLDDDGLDAYLEKIYIQVDLFATDVKIGDQQFLSPIAALAPTFYKYYIVDTLKDVTPQLVKLYFSPRNKSDRLFQGELYIALDGSYALQEATLSLGKEANVNWINNFRYKVNYDHDPEGHYYLSRSRMDVEMSLYKGKRGLAGARVFSLKDYRSGDVPLPSRQEQAHEQGDIAAYRHDTLGQAEASVYANMDSLQNTKGFRRIMDLGTLLLSGYKELGPVEVGPINSFYSFNPIEGFRLKAGGRTTDKLSKRFTLRAHAAYGFKDQRMKYAVGGTWSFTGNSIFKFPVRSMDLSVSDETMIPGQGLAFIEEDNFLMSFKRGQNDKWMYERKVFLEYLHEFKNHFSFRAGYRYSQLVGAGALAFAPVREGRFYGPGSLVVSEVSGSLRWAPEEQFYQGKKYRRPIINRYPVFTLRATAGWKGLLNGKFSYQHLSFNVYKRFYMSQLGFSDITLEGGKIWGKVPYPLLLIHRANQSYAYQLNSYNMMNFLEFLSDKYISLNFDHSFNGFLFNKVPLLKKLKLREVASLKVLYGGIRKENDPYTSDTGFRLKELQGKRYSFGLQEKPYVEASLGVSNIFKLVRVDVVKRLTYLDHPFVSEWGIRMRVALDF